MADMAVLRTRLEELAPVVVAFSGGADSAFLAWVAGEYRAGRTTLERSAVVAWAEEHGRSDAWADWQITLLIESEDARRHPDIRGVILLAREPEDPLADLANYAA